MEPKKISQLPLTTNPSLTGITTVVVSGETYSTSLESLKNIMVDEQEHTFEGNQIITGNLTVNGEIIGKHILPNVTYAELINLINTSGLTPLSYYLLTDFATTYYILDGRGNRVSETPVVGEVEPLIIFSTSQYTIDSQVYSTKYHDDIIYYDWDYTKFQTDYSFLEIPNFKGVIEYRKEVIYNNSAGWDIRAVKFRRWESTAPLWLTGTIYQINDITLWNSKIYKSLTINKDKQPDLLTSQAHWVMMINLTNNIHWNTNATGITFDGITIPSGPSYYDFYSILLDHPSSYNNEIGISLVNFGENRSRLLNITLFGASHDIHIKENCSVLTIGNICSNFDIRYGCNRMIFGINNRNILIRSNSNSLIFSEGVSIIDLGVNTNNSLFGYNCNDITVGQNVSNITFGVSCRSINIGSYCNTIFMDTNCSKIKIGSSCHDINIKSSCTIITMNESCSNIDIDNLSRSLIFENTCDGIKLPTKSIYNKFESNSSGDLRDYPISDYAIADYCCTIFKNSEQNVFLRYFDGNNNNNTVFISVPPLV